VRVPVWVWEEGVQSQPIVRLSAHVSYSYFHFTLADHVFEIACNLYGPNRRFCDCETPAHSAAGVSCFYMFLFSTSTGQKRHGLPLEVTNSLSRARVAATYRRDRSSRSICSRARGSFAFWIRDWGGISPSDTPTRKTTRNSSPLARCIVPQETPSRVRVKWVPIFSAGIPCSVSHCSYFSASQLLRARIAISLLFTPSPSNSRMVWMTYSCSSRCVVK